LQKGEQNYEEESTQQEERPHETDMESGRKKASILPEMWV